MFNDNLVFAYTHSEINAHFNKDSRDFIVREVPLYEFSGSGEHLIIHLQKKSLSTNEILKIISSTLGISIKEIGYAGLKDKQGLTSQYISINKKYSQNLHKIEDQNIKILDTFLHNNKIKLGHLKGNKFFIRLKKVSKVDALKLEQALLNIATNGFLNYFGYQRFGKFGDNYIQGEQILKKEKKLKDKKLSNFLISAYQSKLFNDYASLRMKLSHLANSFNANELAQIYKISQDEAKKITSQKTLFKLISGEIMCHYPHGKLFAFEDGDFERFANKEISPTGLLPGKTMTNTGYAKNLEDEIYHQSYDLCKDLNGDRRYLWSFLEEHKCFYDEQNAHFCVEFTLQKGSYATVVLSELLHRWIDID